MVATVTEKALYQMLARVPVDFSPDEVRPRALRTAGTLVVDGKVISWHGWRSLTTLNERFSMAYLPHARGNFKKKNRLVLGIDFDKTSPNVGLQCLNSDFFIQIRKL